MGKKVDLDDLLDVADVAELIGLSNPKGVSTYQRRYEDFPAPIWASRGGRCQLWLRTDVEKWDRLRTEGDAR
ncbi:hypothetical protein [Dermatobacter hominis]|uniref:hypothetical protein n=1 Tax=Dermatobacter hominis TaxID=2884263 RepID=UPI001D1286F5|nr:hypothetical protein [Dermatobacter hominis]UDY35531.1 hypothetical protein LH044_19645 [Dermatobacter hominis]